MERIKTALKNTLELKGQEYINAFVNRSSGSRWSSKVKDVDALLDLKWKEMIPDPSLVIDGCTYFKTITKSALGLGFLNVFDLRECNFPVDFHEGEHGIELVGAKEIKGAKTREAHLILGICKGREIIYTAFPGGLFCSIKKFPGKSIGELRALNIPFAVKPCPVSWLEFQAEKQGINLKNSVLLLSESLAKETELESLNYGNLLNWRDSELNEGIEEEVCKSWRSFLKYCQKDKHYVLVGTEEKIFNLATRICMEVLDQISVVYISSDYEDFAVSKEKHRVELRRQVSSFRNYKN